MIVLRGLTALLFGLAGLIRPAATLTFVLALFVAYAVATGVCALVAAVRIRRHGNWQPLALLAFLNGGAAALTVILPGPGAYALVTLIAVYAFLSGVLDTWMAVRLRTVVRGEWLLGLAGALSIACSGYFVVSLLLFPWASAFALVWLLCPYAIVVGIVFILFGLRARSSFGGAVDAPANAA